MQYYSSAPQRLLVEIEGLRYTRKSPGRLSCSVGPTADGRLPIFIRGRIYSSGELFGVCELSTSDVSLVGLACIPSSLELISPGHFYAGQSICPRGAAVAFEWGSRLRCMHFEAFPFTNIRSLCLPASVQSFQRGVKMIPDSLEVVTFESSFASLKGSGLSADPERCVTLLGYPTYILGSRNPHFAVVGQSLMNFERTTLLHHCCRSDCDVTIDSTIQELAPASFRRVSITTLAFAQPSRLRIIGSSAFAICPSLGAVVIPSTVEVIGAHAFGSCRSLREVRFEKGSRLRMIEESAFDGCTQLGPVDVPSRAAIGEYYNVVEHVYDDHGVEHVRVQFFTFLDRL
jgi:hypothetical protein